MQSSVDRRATSPPTQSTTVKPGDNDKSKIALVALQDENRALKNVIDRLRSESKDSRKRCGELEHTVASYASMQEEIQTELQLALDSHDTSERRWSSLLSVAVSERDAAIADKSLLQTSKNELELRCAQLEARVLTLTAFADQISQLAIGQGHGTSAPSYIGMDSYMNDDDIQEDITLTIALSQSEAQLSLTKAVVCGREEEAKMAMNRLLEAIRESASATDAWQQERHDLVSQLRQREAEVSLVRTQLQATHLLSSDDALSPSTSHVDAVLKSALAQLLTASSGITLFCSSNFHDNESVQGILNQFSDAVSTTIQSCKLLLHQSSVQRRADSVARLALEDDIASLRVSIATLNASKSGLEEQSMELSGRLYKLSEERAATERLAQSLVPSDTASLDLITELRNQILCYQVENAQLQQCLRERCMIGDSVVPPASRSPRQASPYGRQSPSFSRRVNQSHDESLGSSMTRIVNTPLLYCPSPTTLPTPRLSAELVQKLENENKMLTLQLEAMAMQCARKRKKDKERDQELVRLRQQMSHGEPRNPKTDDESLLPHESYQLAVNALSVAEEQLLQYKLELEMTKKLLENTQSELQQLVKRQPSCVFCKECEGMVEWFATRQSLDETIHQRYRSSVKDLVLTSEHLRRVVDVDNHDTLMSKTGEFTPIQLAMLATPRLSMKATTLDSQPSTVSLENRQDLDLLALDVAELRHKFNVELHSLTCENEALLMEREALKNEIKSLELSSRRFIDSYRRSVAQLEESLAKLTDASSARESAQRYLDSDFSRVKRGVDLSEKRTAKVAAAISMLSADVNLSESTASEWGLEKAHLQHRLRELSDNLIQSQDQVSVLKTQLQQVNHQYNVEIQAKEAAEASLQQHETQGRVLRVRLEQLELMLKSSEKEAVNSRNAASMAMDETIKLKADIASLKQHRDSVVSELHNIERQYQQEIASHKNNQALLSLQETELMNLRERVAMLEQQHGDDRRSESEMIQLLTVRSDQILAVIESSKGAISAAEKEKAYRKECVVGAVEQLADEISTLASDRRQLLSEISKCTHDVALESSYLRIEGHALLKAALETLSDGVAESESKMSDMAAIVTKQTKSMEDTVLHASHRMHVLENEKIEMLDRWAIEETLREKDMEAMKHALNVLKNQLTERDAAIKSLHDTSALASALRHELTDKIEDLQKTLEKSNIDHKLALASQAKQLSADLYDRLEDAEREKDLEMDLLVTQLTSSVTPIIHEAMTVLSSILMERQSFALTISQCQSAVQSLAATQHTSYDVIEDITKMALIDRSDDNNDPSIDTPTNVPRIGSVKWDDVSEVMTSVATVLSAMSETCLRASTAESELENLRCQLEAEQLQSLEFRINNDEKSVAMEGALAALSIADEVITSLRTEMSNVQNEYNMLLDHMRERATDYDTLIDEVEMLQETCHNRVVEYSTTDSQYQQLSRAISDELPNFQELQENFHSLMVNTMNISDRNRSRITQLADDVGRVFQIADVIEKETWTENGQLNILAEEFHLVERDLRQILSELMGTMMDSRQLHDEILEEDLRNLKQQLSKCDVDRAMILSREAELRQQLTLYQLKTQDLEVLVSMDTEERLACLVDDRLTKMLQLDNAELPAEIVLRKAQKEIDILKQEIEEAVKRANMAQDTARQAEISRRVAEEQVHALQDECQQQTEAAMSADAIVRDLRIKMANVEPDVVEREKQELFDQLTTARQTICQLESTMAELESSQVAVDELLQVEMNEVTTLSNSLDALQQENEQLLKSLAIEKATTQTLSAALVNSQTSLSELHQQALTQASNNKEIDDLKILLQTAQDNYNNAEFCALALETNIIDLDECVRRLEDEKLEQTARITSLEADNADTLALLNRERDNVDRLQKLLNDSETVLLLAKSEADNSQKRRHNLTTATEALGDQVESLQQQLQLKEQERNHLHQTLLTIQEQYHGLTEKESAVVSALEAARRQVLSLQAANDHLASTLSVSESDGELMHERLRLVEDSLQECELQLRKTKEEAHIATLVADDAQLRMESLITPKSMQNIKGMFNSTVDDIRDILEDVETEMLNTQDKCVEAEAACAIASNNASVAMDRAQNLEKQVSVLTDTIGQYQKERVDGEKIIVTLSELENDMNSILDKCNERKINLEEQVEQLKLMTKEQDVIVGALSGMEGIANALGSDIAIIETKLDQSPLSMKTQAQLVKLLENAGFEIEKLRRELIHTQNMNQRMDDNLYKSLVNRCEALEMELHNKDRSCADVIVAAHSEVQLAARRAKDAEVALKRAEDQIGQLQLRVVVAEAAVSQIADVVSKQRIHAQTLAELMEDWDAMCHLCLINDGRLDTLQTLHNNELTSIQSLDNNVNKLRQLEATVLASLDGYLNDESRRLTAVEALATATARGSQAIADRLFGRGATSDSILHDVSQLKSEVSKSKQKLNDYHDALSHLEDQRQQLKWRMAETGGLKPEEPLKESHKMSGVEPRVPLPVPRRPSAISVGATQNPSTTTTALSNHGFLGKNGVGVGVKTVRNVPKISVDPVDIVPPNRPSRSRSRSRDRHLLR